MIAWKVLIETGMLKNKEYVAEYSSSLIPGKSLEETWINENNF